MLKDKYIVGVDVAKQTLVIHRLPEEKRSEVPNVDAGINKLVNDLPAHALVVYEPTNVFHRKLSIALAQRGIAAVALNPRQSRDFAKGEGLLAKTDAVDARALALYGWQKDPKPTIAWSQQQQELADLVARRDQLISMRTEEKNRAKTSSCQMITDSIETVIESLNAQIKLIEAKIDQLIKGKEEWKEKAKVLESVCGVGPVLTMKLIAYLPELGKLSRKAVARLVGVAPVNRDSGKYRGKRTCFGGRAKIRCTLAMAARVAARHNEKFKKQYQGLVERGKFKKVAETAVMRKLIIMLNGMMRDHLHKKEENPC
jgi:transposase